MKRYILTLLLALAPSIAMAQTAIVFEYDPSATLYARLYTSSSAAVAVAFTAGTSGNTRLYTISEADLTNAGLTPTTTAYPFTVFTGTPSTSASDTPVGAGVTVVPVANQVLGATLSSYNTSNSVGQAFNWLKAAFVSSGKYSTNALENAPSGGGGGGTSQPRINHEPDPFTTIQVSRRTDGTYKCTRPIRLTAGAINDVYVFIDMSPMFGKTNFVENVGTAVISTGDITQGTDNGPRDTYAVLELDGTTTSDCEITVPVTMESGTTVPVVFDVEMLGE